MRPFTTVAVMHQALFFFLVATIMVFNESEMLETTLTPKGCICPQDNYTCLVEDGVEIAWITNITMRNEFEYSLTDSDDEIHIHKKGFKVSFRREEGGKYYYSTLYSEDVGHLNGTHLICDGAGIDVELKRLYTTNDSVTICVVGPASAPTNLTVMCDSSTAMVNFHRPVYGGECVDYYVVTAVSEQEEKKVLCAAITKLAENCTVSSLNGNVYNYNFTVHGVIHVNDSLSFIGALVTECCLPHPECLRATEYQCGFQKFVNISWEGVHNKMVNATISWHGVHSSGATHYERGSSEDSHLLILDYSETGPVEIAVTFSSAVCNKTTVTHYLVEGVLTSVSLRSRTLVIESRDCIASPENYRIVVTSTDTPSTELANISFSPTIEHDVGDVVRPNTQYTIIVQIVEVTSGVVIDEMTTSIVWHYCTPTSVISKVTVTVTEQVACSDVINSSCDYNIEKKDGDTGTFSIVVGAVGSAVIGGLVGISSTLLIVVRFKKKKDATKYLPRAERCVGKSEGYSTVCDVRAASGTPAVVYETVSDVVTTTGPDTSENVAYGVSHSLPTTHNPAYERALKN